MSSSVGFARKPCPDSTVPNLVQLLSDLPRGGARNVWRLQGESACPPRLHGTSVQLPLTGRIRVQIYGTGIIPWSPLGRGYMTRPWRDQDSTTRAKTDRNFARFVGLGNPVEEEALHKINEAYVCLHPECTWLRLVPELRLSSAFLEQGREGRQEPRRLDGAGKFEDSLHLGDRAGMIDREWFPQVTTAWVLAQPQVTAPIIGVSFEGSHSWTRPSLGERSPLSLTFLYRIPRGPAVDPTGSAPRSCRCDAPEADGGRAQGDLGTVQAPRHPRSLVGAARRDVVCADLTSCAVEMKAGNFD